MQLTYNMNPAAAVAGMVADMRLADIISKVAQGAVPVGLLCAAGTDAQIFPPVTLPSVLSSSPGQVIPFPAAIADDPLLDSEWVGIPIYDSSRAPYDSTNAYSDTDPVGVLRRGPIWVNSETAITTQYADAYVRVTAGGGFLRGSWRQGASAGFVKFPRGRWVTTNAAAGLAILEVW